MTTQFLHGVETIEIAGGTFPIKISAAAPIGLIGTAPLAAAAAFPLNTPVLLTAAPLAATKLGATGTLLQAIQQIYAEAGAAVVVVRVADDPLPANVMNNIIGSVAAKTGVNAFRNAEALVGVKPRTFIAPGYTSQRPQISAAGVTPVVYGPNPVIAALIPIATDLRGRIYGDAPSDSDAAALAWRNDWDNERVICFYPSVEVWDETAAAYVAAPASSSNAGLTSRVLTNQGFWYSPSNNAFNGVGGISSPIDYSDNPNDQANILNSNDIVVCINSPSQGYTGWRRWGNRTCATSSLAFQFESVRTACDMVYEAVQQAQAWAVDKPPSIQLLREMQTSIQAFFDYLTHIGALVGGRVWLDPEKNTPEQTSAGIWAWDFDPTPPAPMEHIQNYAQLNDAYYTNLVSAIQSSLNGG